MIHKVYWYMCNLEMVRLSVKRDSCLHVLIVITDLT